MHKRKHEAFSLSDHLKDFIEVNKLDKGLDKVQAASAWNKVMGVAISKYTTDIKFEKDTLYVRLSSSTLREELSYGNQKIIQLINEELGKDLIKKLILR